jgi:hypothetical protein
MLEEIVGRNVIAEFKERYPCDWIDLLREVRRKKTILGYEHNYISYSNLSIAYIQRFGWQGYTICN